MLKLNILSKTHSPTKLHSMLEVYEQLDHNSFEYRLASQFFAAENSVDCVYIVNDDFNQEGRLFVDGSCMDKEEILNWIARARERRFYLHVYNMGGCSV